MESECDHIVPQDINNTQEIAAYIDPMEFRLDILRLTFTVEAIVEDYLLKIFVSKQIKEKEFIDNWFINKASYEVWKKWYKKHMVNAVPAIWNTKMSGETFVNIPNAIKFNTFGGLIKLIENIKTDKYIKLLREVAPNIEIRIFKKWLNYIKVIRNTLAHTTNIFPLTFFEKIQTPPASKTLNTKDLPMIDFKKKVLSYMILPDHRTDKILEIFEKYNFNI